MRVACQSTLNVRRGGSGLSGGSPSPAFPGDETLSGRTPQCDGECRLVLRVHRGELQRWDGDDGPAAIQLRDMLGFEPRGSPETRLSACAMCATPRSTVAIMAWPGVDGVYGGASNGGNRAAAMAAVAQQRSRATTRGGRGKGEGGGGSPSGARRPLTTL